MNPADKFKLITTFALDVDGVLTDGTVLVLENGLQARRMSIRDGYGLQLAVKKGYRVIIISGAATSPVVDRLNKLGVHDVFMGVADKKQFLLEFATSQSIDPSAILFMGDDIPDLSAMQVVGLAACPADSVSEIKELAQYISPVNGGMGCVRDVIEKVLKARNDWDDDVSVASK